MTVAMVTHERSLAERYATRLVFLADGKLVADQANAAPEAVSNQTGGRE
jgi:ABC-type polar amino acid transport system ATPase subunit